MKLTDRLGFVALTIGELNANSQLADGRIDSAHSPVHLELAAQVVLRLPLVDARGLALR